MSNLSQAQSAQQGNRTSDGKYTFGTHAEPAGLALGAEADPKVTFSVSREFVSGGRSISEIKVAAGVNLTQLVPGLAESSTEEQQRFARDHVRALDIWSRNAGGAGLEIHQDTGELRAIRTWTNADPHAGNFDKVTEQSARLLQDYETIRSGALALDIEAQIGTQGYGEGENGKGSAMDPSKFEALDYLGKQYPAEAFSGHQREALVHIQSAIGAAKLSMEASGYAGEANAYWNSSDGRMVSATIDIDGLVSQFSKEPADSANAPWLAPVPLTKDSVEGRALTASGIRLRS